MKRDVIKGVCQSGVDLKPFNTWHIGGKAERLFWPKDLHDLERFMATLPDDEPVTWLGLGSNTLVDDVGIAGTVIITQGALQDIAVQGDGTIRAEAGVSCAQLARFAAKQEQGVCAEFLAGIPGTVGGALFMNAGCFGGETWNRVVAVDVINHRGEVTRRSADKFKWGYRHIKGLADDEWFVAGVFKFEQGPGAESLATIKTLLSQRASSQPTGQPCCGSVFRNPEGDHAGRLIESLALKGYQVGGAVVSGKHANFIINTDNASSQDVLGVIEHIREQVKTKYSIDLMTEMKHLGGK